jgi:hypothetical protein
LHAHSSDQWRGEVAAAQEKQVRGLIANKLPGQLKLSFALQTRTAVAELLEQQFGLKMPLRTMVPVS